MRRTPSSSSTPSRNGAALARPLLPRLPSTSSPPPLPQPPWWSSRKLTQLFLSHRWAQDPQFKDKTYFAKFDVDHLPELSQELGIRAMPTFLIFKDGKKVDEFVGANPPALLNLLKKYNPEDAAEKEGSEKAESPKDE